jgi:hypothetical protein
MWRASPMKAQGLPEIGDEWFGVDTGQHAGHEALLLNVFKNLYNCQVPEKRAVSVPAVWLNYRVSETAGHRRQGLITGGDSYYVWQ